MHDNKNNESVLVVALSTLSLLLHISYCNSLYAVS